MAQSAWAVECTNCISAERLDCSRENLVFLFGALINLTVRVDVYFHPIRMTYPIQPEPFFRAAPNWGKPAKHFLLLRSFQTGQTSYCPLSFFAAASRNHEEGHLVYGPLESILFDQGFPVEYELDATHRNNFKSPPALAMMTVIQNSTLTASHFIPGQHFLEIFTLLSPNNQDHAFMGDLIIPILNQLTQPLLHL